MYTLIRNQNELDHFCDGENYHCVNISWVLNEAVDELACGFPIILEDMGYNHLGRGFRIHSKNNIEKLKEIIGELDL
jgi:hypothetical protein